MWKTHCQLSQTLDCSCCCEGWHNQLLHLGAILFYVVPCRFGQILSLTWKHYFKTAFCIYSGYLCVILKLVWWSESFKCDKYAKNKNRKGAKKIHTTVCAQFSWMIKWTLFILIKYSIQGFNILFITYTIIQNVTSSEMQVRSAPWTVQLYEIQTQENRHKYRYEKNEVKKIIKCAIKENVQDSILNK